jgi:hypothetical protein
MRIVMTLLVRDEEDVVGELLRYHLQQGVDFVVATDHRSIDGTTDILRSYEREGHLHLLREESESISQSECVTRMARLAASDFGADWVINCDADEFWWPRDGPLRDVLESVPQRFGVVYGAWRHFVLRPETGEPFYERMVARRRTASFESAYHANVKALHRGAPDVHVSSGNHAAVGRGLVPLRTWFAFEVLHFPIRSPAQLRRKYVGRPERLGIRPSPSAHAADRGVRERGAEAVAREYLVDDDALAAGLTDGTLAIDVRLRDALREPDHPRPRATLAEDIALAAEFSPYQLLTALQRVDESAEQLERRLSKLESTIPLRLTR